MKTLFRLGLLTLLLAWTLPAVAQKTSEPQTFTLPGGYTISLPGDWDSEADDETGGIYLSNADFTLFLLMPGEVAEAVEIDGDSDVETLMSDLNIALYNWKPDNIETLQIGSYEASQVSYTIEGDEFEGYSYIIQVDDETFVFVDAVTDKGNLDALEAVMLDALPTITLGEVVAGEPCFVSTDAVRTVQLRVGPGENRASVAFLPEDQDFEVQARFVTDDEAIWYKLDKESAAPASAASEIWVAQENVDERGGCATVADTSAPPIIPIVVNPPAGGNTSSTGNTVSPPPAASGGEWTAVLSEEADTSCAGTDNFHVRSNEVFSPTTFPVSIFTSGGVFYLDGVAFSKTASGYAGSMALSNGNAQLSLSVINANLITGQIVANAVFDGVACSATMGITISR